MVIHVVKPGDSIWTLSKRYGVNSNKILEANGLQQEDTLVVGQAVVIPGIERTYRVKQWESLWNVSNKMDVPMRELIEENKMEYPYRVYPGDLLRIPERPNPYGYIEVNAFIQPSSREKERSIIEGIGTFLTYIGPFSYHVQSDGSLMPIDDEEIIAAGREKRVAPMLCVSNLKGANFDTALIDEILNSPSMQDTVINNIRTTLRNKRYYGVIIDFERISPKNRELYNSLLRKITTELHRDNYIVATALAPKTSDIREGSWHGAHDYKAHGEIVDFVVIMTYEWGWSGGPPLAVAPLSEVRKVIQYAVSVIPPKKIMMGMPFYGYDWTLPYLPGGEFAKSIGNDEAIDIARRYNTAIRYDLKAQSPFFNYRDEEKREHVVWFEDARSVKAKYMLASEYGLRGVSYWALGKPFTPNWVVLDDMFSIVKVIR